MFAASIWSEFPPSLLVEGTYLSSSKRDWRTWRWYSMVLGCFSLSVMTGAFSDLVGEGREVLMSRSFRGEAWGDIVKGSWFGCGCGGF